MSQRFDKWLNTKARSDRGIFSLGRKPFYTHTQLDNFFDEADTRRGKPFRDYNIMNIHELEDAIKLSIRFLIERKYTRFK